MIEDYEGPVRLGEVRFGERDPELGKLVCTKIQEVMPATMIAWRRGHTSRLKRVLRSMHLHTEIGEDPNAVRPMQPLRVAPHPCAGTHCIYESAEVPEVRPHEVQDR